MMNKPVSRRSWLQSVASEAISQGVVFPRFVNHAMGTAQTPRDANGRFVTFKRRLVSQAQADIDGVEWTLWVEANELPDPILAFRESDNPSDEAVSRTFRLLRGWLIDGWSIEELRAAARLHPGVQAETHESEQFQRH